MKTIKSYLAPLIFLAFAMTFAGVASTGFLDRQTNSASAAQDCDPSVPPIADLFRGGFWFEIDGVDYTSIPWLITPLLAVISLLVLTALMHTARGMGWMHGNLAKNLLVKAG